MQMFYKITWFFHTEFPAPVNVSVFDAKNDKDQRTFEVEYSIQNNSNSDESETSDNSVADFLISNENVILDFFDICSESEWIISYSPIIRTSAL